MSNPKENKDKTILVVDDEAVVLDVVEAFIEQLGHKVLLARSGHEALKASREHDGKVDLLLTDVIMPKMNGLELAKTVRGVRLSYLDKSSCCKRGLLLTLIVHINLYRA